MNIFKRIFNWGKESSKKFTEPSVEAMIKHLLDKTSSDLGGRDDCAMDLGDYDLPEVEATLIQVVMDHSEDEMLVDSAIESLIQIWNRQNRYAPEELISQMHPTARDYFNYGNT